MTAPEWTSFEVVARILAERLRGPRPSAELRAALVGRTIEWDRVVAQASADFVLASFAAVVHDHKLAGSLEPELSAFLRKVHAANVERNRAMRDELAELVGVLNPIGVEPVLLKGAIRLVDGLYPDIGWRMMRDLDILVPTTRRADVVEALRGAGYAPRRSATEEELRALQHHHYPQLLHPGRLAAVEVHTELFASAKRRRLLPAAQMLGASRPVTFGGVRARLPSLEHQVVHLIGHSQVSNRGYLLGVVALRDRLEAAALAHWSSDGVAWDAVVARFAAAGYRRPLLGFLLSLDDGAFCTVPHDLRIGWLARLQGRRVALQARSTTMMRLGSRIGWYAALLGELLLDREVVRHKTWPRSVDKMIQRLYRGPVTE